MNVFAWFRRSRFDDLSAEIQSHIEEKTDELVASGMSRDEAERAALRAFGDITRVKERSGDVWRLASFLENLGCDVRHALRGLVQKSAFTIAVILTLALGIGANAVVFALVNAIVLRPLPYPHAERLISVANSKGEGKAYALRDWAYDEWAKSTRTVDLSAAYQEIKAVLQTSDGPARITGLAATHTYFPIFGVHPLLGRTFTEGEALPGAPQVVVLSEQLWRERFAADSAILGRSASFGGVRRQVIGVLPASFTYGRPEQFWVALRIAPVRYAPNAESGEVVEYTVVARLREGVSLEAVRLELARVLARRTQEDFTFSSDFKSVVMTLHERRHGETRRPLLLLFGAVGVLLLTACANIANLSLARAARREREFAMRLALGASRWRITSFVLIENLALAAGGASLGLLLVTASLGWFVRVSPDAIRNVDAIAVDGALIAFTSVVAIVTALLFGLVPALTAARAGLSRTLASATQNMAGSKRQSVARRTLVVGELAIALVFLTGAGLVAKTFWHVTAMDPGLRPEKLLVADIDLGETRYTYATASAFFDDLLARVRRAPGVISVAYADAPQVGSASGLAIIQSGAKPDGTPRWVLGWGEVAVGPEYFETIGAELVAGRFFGPDDRAGAPRVAVVSEQYVREQLAGAPAIGRTIDEVRQRTIVGVVKDVSRPTTEGRRYPLVYAPMAQVRGSQDDQKTHRGVFVRTSGEPERLEAPIRAAVQALDAAQPAPTFTTMESTLAERVAPRKFTLVLLSAFALLAGSLAVIGLYSVLAYLVAERTREIGIRMAVGADRARVTRMILGQGLRLTLIGAILGGLASIAAVRVLRAWMYEMSVYDAPTFTAVAVLLCIVALIASWLPARRASRVDPVLALRAD